MFSLCAGTAIILAAIGKTAPAVGVVIGFALFVVNSLFLYEAGHSILKSGSKGHGRAIAGLASLGRLMFMALALVVVTQVDYVAFLAASGWLICSQMVLPLLYLRRGKGVRCSNT